MADLLTFQSGNPDQRLLDAGYRNVFDIASTSRAAFVESIPSLTAKDARAVYRQARQRADNLKALYRAWQLRQEPVIGKLAKLNTWPDAPALKDALIRNIGGDGDFSDLIERASAYADAASIQSLFSPGRYAAALYRVASALHDTDSHLHIDQRRPDLKDLVLSETTMQQQVTSLDLLLQVLQSGGEPIDALSDRYFPMTLPYDDNLAQINAALSAQARTLNGLWDTLTDATAQAVSRQAFAFGAARRVGTVRADGDYLPGNVFYLQALDGDKDPMVYLSQYTSGNGVSGAQLIKGNPDHALAAIVAPLALSWSVAQHCYYLGVPDGTQMADEPNHVLNGCFLRGNSSTNADQDGNFAQMASRSGGTEPQSGFHLPITPIPGRQKNQYYLKTDKGYVGVDTSGQSNWKDALIVTAPWDKALLVAMRKDAEGHPIEDGSTPFPEVVFEQPSPPARETLSLTPVSYQLMTNTELSETDIADHYGMEDVSLRSAGSLATTLNSIATFCEKTRLRFNQLLELTAQYAYDENGKESGARSRFLRFGKRDPVRVNEYGAAYLNGVLDDADADPARYLWVQKDGKNLNLTDETVVELAGRAEKLVRLSNSTGLSFEALDWVIVNASRCVPEHHNKPVLDKPVLEALAEYVRLKQRYGLDVNTFVTFIDAANPYAPDQVLSFYASAFRPADGGDAIALGTTVNYARDQQDALSAICCKALGVTSDEFERIGSGCFGGAGQFTLDEHTAGQLYRFGAIPRLLGLTFAQAEVLWRLMAGGQDSLLEQLGQPQSLVPLAMLSRTEKVLDWMASVGLNLFQLQGMVSTVWSGTATAEMFNFLKNVCDSVNPSSTAATRQAALDEALQQKVLRALAAGFNLKSNVMGGVTTWLEKITANAENAFTLAGYWQAIQTRFSQTDVNLDDLQKDTGLVQATQRLSQLVLIAQWLTLTEQDLQLLTSYPDRLVAGAVTVPAPDMTLLLTLSRFKQWQTQVVVSRDEAMRCFDQLNAQEMTFDAAAALIASLHKLDTKTVAQMSVSLLGKDTWPKSFDVLWQLLTWLRAGQALNVGTTTLEQLQTMMRADPSAEDRTLLAAVAQNLSAGISARQ
ncbi:MULTISPECIES: Tc toxin subunit A [Burkholderiaceae]|uniref:Tc toxin subunit A n=1 Tax=Burkholderiaceae TaxID=119060 RepID=UPI0009591B67|nr:MULTISPECIES: Tc toxin subunit A [Burkholderiaceae]MCG1039595.1 insecticidal toxin complex protein TcaA [Mycetohabitans sp. B7]SIT69995.1 virulence plasmid A protein [Burkholderia sp. b14]